jgi:steroid delta-isomerase-like uncharacterized protein
MSTEQHKIRARHWFDAINRGDLSAVEEIFASDCVLHLGAGPESPPGRESIRQLISSFRTAFPDLHLEVEQILAEDDAVAVRWTATGTHEGILMGMGRTGKRARWTGVSILRFAQDKVVEDWVHMDSSAMLQQLGLAAG